MAIEFKSRTFAYNQMKEDELAVLANDAKIIQIIDEHKFPDILVFVKRLIEAKTTDDELGIHNEAVGKIVPSRQVGMSVHRFCYYFFRIFISEDTQEDTPEELASDLGQLDVGNVNKLTTLIELIKQETPWFKKFRLKNSYKKGLFPCIKSIGSTVELRGVFNKEINEQDSLDKYTKEVQIEDLLLPVISVSISLDSGEPDRFVFQGSPEDIESLIKRLKAALHKSLMLVEKSKG